MKLGKDITLKRAAQEIVNYIYDIFFFILSIITLPIIRMIKERTGNKKVLLVSNRALMAEYLAEIPEILGNTINIDYYLLNYFLYDREYAQLFITEKLPYKRISRFLSFFIRWDLIISASVPQRSLINNLRCPTLRIQHGITGGKHIEGKGMFTLGENVYRNNHSGKIRFSSIFVSSEKIRQDAINLDTQFKNIVRVVGFYRDDLMIKRNKSRDQIREQFGFGKNDKVIFVLSTWGPNCLFNKIGDVFLSEARNCMDSFRFIINIHPMEHRPKPNGVRVWGEYLRTKKKYGFIVHEPTNDWIDCMIASDILISDHTSLSLHGVLLNKPVIFSPFPNELLQEGGLTWKLKEFSPLLCNDASDLRDKLNWTIEKYPLGKLKALAKEINSCPGKAKELYKKEILNLLSS